MRQVRARRAFRTPRLLTLIQFAYTATVFLTAAGSLILEIVAGRLIAPYVGMSLYTWTAIIAVVLAGLSVGHWIGGRLAAGPPDAPRGRRRIAWSLVLAAPASLAVLPLIRAVSGPILGSSFGAIVDVVVLTSVLFFLPSLLVGIVSPIATKLAIDADPDNAGLTLGRMFAAGASGSIIGTLAAGYFFISWLGTTKTVISVAILYAVIGAAFALWSKRGPAVALVLIAATGAVSTWTYAKGAFRSPCEIESDYFCIRFDDFSPVSARPSKLMILDHLVHSINDRDNPMLLYSPYMHFVEELRRRNLPDAEPFRAYFIGGGGYTLPRGWAHQMPGSEITVAEIDPMVTQAARDFMWLDTDRPALDIHHEDARVLLATYPPSPRFDVMFGDAFHDIAVPAHLVTREFHQLMKARMTDRGFYALNVIDDGSNPRFMLALAKTLTLDFPAVEVWTPLEEVNPGGRLTFIVIAGNHPTGASRVRASFGIVRSWARIDPAQLDGWAEGNDIPVLTDDFAPVEQLLSKFLLQGTEG